MPYYVASRHRRQPKPIARNYAPGEVWLLGRPEVGRRMSLLSRDGARSMLTSSIVRVLERAGHVYVQTRGSLYRLEAGELE